MEIQGRSTGKTLTRSEGLAVASFDMFLDGGFSSDPTCRCRPTSPACKRLNKNAAEGPTSSARRTTPWLGFDGRLGLLHKLADADHDAQEASSATTDPRLGNIYDYLGSHAGEQ